MFFHQSTQHNYTKNIMNELTNQNTCLLCVVICGLDGYTDSKPYLGGITCVNDDDLTSHITKAHNEYGTDAVKYSMTDSGICYHQITDETSIFFYLEVPYNEPYFIGISEQTINVQPTNEVPPSGDIWISKHDENGIKELHVYFK